jgi:signal transduction histidine kinase
MSAEWLIVVNADGTVLAVDGGAPLDWIDQRLQECGDVPASARILTVHAVPVHLSAVDLRALLKSTMTLMEQQARAIGVALTLDVAPDVPPALRLDPEKIAWTLTALIGNALRFVRRGTRLMPGGTIQVRALRGPVSSHVVLEVQDDGSGIPADMLPQLLRRSPGPLHASGLALSLVQDVIAAHGGEIRLDSSTEADRSGTTVRLIIPCP